MNLCINHHQLFTASPARNTSTHTQMISCSSKAHTWYWFKPSGYNHSSPCRSRLFLSDFYQFIQTPHVCDRAFVCVHNTCDRLLLAHARRVLVCELFAFVHGPYRPVSHAHICRVNWWVVKSVDKCTSLHDLSR